MSITYFTPLEPICSGVWLETSSRRTPTEPHWLFVDRKPSDATC